jgi:hypothetical protein
MDPWLETPHVWPGFHGRLINETATILQPELRARGYFIDAGERIWLAEPSRAVYPDDAVFRAQPMRGVMRADSSAVIDVEEPVCITRTPVEVREQYLEIYDIRGRELVTGIEYLSPTNKTTTRGRELYEQEQIELCNSNVHLVEIDLLRGGQHILDIPLDVVRPFHPWHYLINLVRRGTDQFQFYPISVRRRLPRIRIPVKEGDEDAVLDIQRVFDRCYDIGPYPEHLNYESDPVPPLSDEDADWADKLLREKGLRT